MALARTAAIVAGGFAACGCGDVGSEPLVAGEPDLDGSLVLVVSDTMRRDRMGVHGGAAESPRFDAFARDHLVFERAYTHAPWTKPSVATLFTSLHPSQHGVLDHPEDAGRDDGTFVNDVLPDEVTTLAETLADEGFATAAFVGNPWMDERYGFAQGFETYDDSFAAWETPGRTISDAALAWLDTLEDDERFFLYVHYMDCHQPYTPPPPDALFEELERIAADDRELPPGVRATIPKPLKRALRTRGVEPSLALVDVFYEQGVASFDDAFGRLLDGLDAQGLADDAALVVTSDHGEALFERGYGNHGRGLYEDELAIPLAAHFPGVPASGAVDELFGLVDVMPTVLGQLGVDVPVDAQGRDLFVETSRATLVAEGVADEPDHRAVYHEDLKLLWQPHGGPAGVEQALFDVVDDPEERHDLLDERAAAALVDELLDAADDAVPAHDVPDGAAVPVDPATAERLRDLGYVK